MAAVEASRPDVPFDTADPLFRFGHGLSFVALRTDPRAASSFDEAAARVGWSDCQGTETDSSYSMPSTEVISMYAGVSPLSSA